MKLLSSALIHLHFLITGSKTAVYLANKSVSWLIHWLADKMLSLSLSLSRPCLKAPGDRIGRVLSRIQCLHYFPFLGETTLIQTVAIVNFSLDLLPASLFHTFSFTHQLHLIVSCIRRSTEFFLLSQKAFASLSAFLYLAAEKASLAGNDYRGTFLCDKICTKLMPC